MEFQGFPKIARLSRECVVTEKIDGTNAQVVIKYANEIGVEGISPNDPDAVHQETYGLAFKDGMYISAGSRNRWLTTGKGDNMGFAGWVKDNAEELFKLGEGQHFGEWWGQGIQRRYGLNEKRFSLFNTFRWYDAYKAMILGYENNFPKCCHVVPVLYQGPFNTAITEVLIGDLNRDGSVAAPGFMDPEGIIIYHEAAKIMFKKTCKDDEKPKGQVNG